VLRFFDGLDLLEPGLVSMTQWRPGTELNPAPLPMWAGVGRKP
jgi:S-adenosyl methyltransferase